jgi:hypothetical protein
MLKLQVIRCVQLVAILAIASQAVTADAAIVTFTDSTFDLTNYSVQVFQPGGATINSYQTLTDGNPGAALRSDTTIPAGGSFRTAEWWLNDSFIYDSSSEGAIQSISYSQDRYFGISGITLSAKGANLVIFQNGNYFLTSNSLPAVNNTWHTGVAMNLVSSDFNLVTDLTTWATSSASHPDFNSGTLQFGFLTGLFVNGSHAVVTGDARIDNLSITISSVPLPAAIWLFGSGLLGLVGISRRKKAV